MAAGFAFHLKSGRTSAPRLPQALRTNRASMSDMRHFAQCAGLWHSSNWKMGASGRIFRRWRQLFNAIAALNTDAPKRSSCYRIRVTRSAQSAAALESWSESTHVSHTNLLNVRIEAGTTSDREIAAAGRAAEVRPDVGAALGRRPCRRRAARCRRAACHPAINPR